MQLVQDHTTQTLEVKQSKFIAHLIPYSLYEETLKSLKHDHPKARHFVVAWRYINEFDQIVEHCSDDGEPKGTSGKPTLAVLAGQGFINSAVIIVRYFGGTKLGTGGLVRAYSDACNDVIAKSVPIPYVKLHKYVFSLKYTDMSLIEYKLQALDILVESKSFDAHGCIIHIATQAELWQKFFTKNQRLVCIKD